MPNSTTPSNCNPGLNCRTLVKVRATRVSPCRLASSDRVGIRA